jgi:glutamine synthetase
MNIAKKFLAANPSVEKVEFIYIDINGIPRGKWASPNTLIKAFNGGLKMPISSLVLDIWGDNPPNTGLLRAGDGDAICRPVETSLGITDWNSRKTAQCLVSMEDSNGEPIFADSRHLLANVLNKFTDLGLKPVIAPELEFNLIDTNLLPNGHPQMPIKPGTNKRYTDVQLLDLDEMQDFEGFFTLVERSAKTLNIPSETAIKECAPGQFEINLLHHDNALLMADQVFLLKRLVRNCAKQFNMNATFMAKPFSNQAGNGMHVHLSIVDQDNNNIFNVDVNKQPIDIFANSIAGILKNTPDFLSFYAMHSNSYRRFLPDTTMAPTTLSWGNENRTALIRIPMAEKESTRLEFRAAGADSNPYLVFAAALSGVLSGIQNKDKLSKETIGNAHKQHPQSLSLTWREAVEKTIKSKTVKKYFGEDFQHAFKCIKLSEIKMFENTITDFEYNSYLKRL